MAKPNKKNVAPKVAPTPQEPKKITLAFTEQELNTIMEVFVKVSLPYAQTAPIIQTIQRQVNGGQAL